MSQSSDDETSVGRRRELTRRRLAASEIPGADRVHATAARLVRASTLPISIDALREAVGDALVRLSAKPHHIHSFLMSFISSFMCVCDRVAALTSLTRFSPLVLRWRCAPLVACS